MALAPSALVCWVTAVPALLLISNTAAVLYICVALVRGAVNRYQYDASRTVGTYCYDV